MAGVRFQSRLFQYPDDDGNPLAGGSITWYVSGTSDLAPVYTTDALSVETTNPMALDADGRMSAEAFLDPAIDYRAALKDSSGAVIAEEDPTSNSAVSAAIEAHNEDPDAHQEATESVFGFTQYASQSETNTGTATDRAITPATLVGRTATETRAGVVELASIAEVATGTDTNRAVTPAGVASLIGATGSLFASSAETLTGTSTAKAITPGGFAANITAAAAGKLKFPGGLFLQWGLAQSTMDDEQTITFPEAFTTACYGVFLQIIAGGANEPLPLNDVASTTGFVVNRSDSLDDSFYFYWAAIGK